MEDTGRFPQLERILRYVKVFTGQNRNTFGRIRQIMRCSDTAKTKKRYAAVTKNKLGLSGDEYIYILDVKCDRLMIWSLLLEKGFFPAYHMNKSSWITILLILFRSKGERPLSQGVPL